MNDNTTSPIHRNRFLGISFIIGMTVFGLLMGYTIRSIKQFDRFVTVRGLSEREVSADLVIWPITFTVSDNDLLYLQNQIQKSRGTVQEFLKTSGFDPSEYSNEPPQITDSESMPESYENNKRRFRYRANTSILLRSTQVAKVKNAMETSDTLVQQGIALSPDYESKPRFLFTGLNQIKPEMVQEANRNARQAAEKFAEDSDSRITTIRRASQGLFEINDLDQSSPDRKTVRVVTTVDFYLE